MTMMMMMMMMMIFLRIMLINSLIEISETTIVTLLLNASQ